MAAKKKGAAALLPPQAPANNNATEGFLDAIQPYTYKYKSPQDEPTNSPTGGDYLGIMAQDAERAPTGNTLVKEDPTGKKYLEIGPMMSALAASAAYLHQRVKTLEGKGNGKRKV